MSIREIVLVPSPVLKKKAAEVSAVDANIRQLLDDMIDTMRAADGVGLAAPQIGVSLRVAVIDAPEKLADGTILSEPGLIEFINPEITQRAGTIQWDEGCLSIPGLQQIMQRSAEVTCQYLDRKGRLQILHAQGLLAVAIQHELDHLNGKLLLDQSSIAKRDLYLQKLKKGKISTKYKTCILP